MKSGAARSLKVVGGLAIVGLAVVAWQLNKSDYLTTDALLAFFRQHEVSAPAVFVLIHVMFAIFFIPCSPLTILAGVLWGPLHGLAYSMAGALGGSCFTFLAGRYLARRYVRSHINKAAISWVLGKADKFGWKIVAFTQINPIFPASTLGYLYGLTRLSFRTYFLVTLLSMLPLQIAFVSAGGSVRNALLFGDLERLWVPVLMMLVSLFILFLLKPLTKSLIEKKVSDGRHAKQNER